MPMMSPANEATVRRAPRLAFLLLKTLDHFAQDLIADLPEASGWEIRAFRIDSPADLGAALAWTDRPELDGLWFEFCWPPFPRLIAETDFGGRRVIVRVHRIEAMEMPYVAQTPWQKVHDLIVVSADMQARVQHVAPGLLTSQTRLHTIHNGLDTDRFAPLSTWNPFRIGWCGLLTLRKNPSLCLHVLAALREEDPRYHLHICSNGGEKLAIESFQHLARRLELEDHVTMDGRLSAGDMPAWHSRNGVLLHTSLHESFGYAIAEAAAVGCDLAVYDHMGAREFWPDATRFGTVDEAVRLVRGAQPHRWRAHVAQSFSLARQLTATAAMLRNDPRPSGIAARSGSVQPPPAGNRDLDEGCLARAPVPTDVCKAAIPPRAGDTHAAPGSFREVAWRGQSFRLIRHGAVDAALQEFCSPFEAGTLAFIDAALPTCSKMIDIGAYVGLMSLYSATRVADVHAFEASPTNFQILSGNVAANNRLPGRIHLYNFGLWECTERLTLYRKAAVDSGTSIFQMIEREEIINGMPEAATTVRDADETLRSIGITRQTLLKIDIEGAEYMVVPRIAGLLREVKPFLHISFHPFNIVPAADLYLRAITRLRIAMQMAEALSCYRFMYFYEQGRWSRIGLEDRMLVFHHYLLQAKRLPRIATAQYGFVDAVGFADDPLPALDTETVAGAGHG
jgi:FkbM family methyltransferase